MLLRLWQEALGIRVGHIHVLVTPHCKLFFHKVVSWRSPTPLEFCVFSTQMSGTVITVSQPEVFAAPGRRLRVPLGVARPPEPVPARRLSQCWPQNTAAAVFANHGKHQVPECTRDVDSRNSTPHLAKYTRHFLPAVLD